MLGVENSMAGKRQGINWIDIQRGFARFRVRFGSDAAPDVADGFAFDEFWVGERSKTVLLEQFTNSSNVADASVNPFVYSLVDNFSREDLAAIQYHVDSDEGKQLDPFHEYNRQTQVQELYFMASVPRQLRL